MANRAEKLRKAYEFKLGKDIASKLSDEQIALISKHYNSLSEDEQSQIDSCIVMGKTNNLSEMANGFIEEEKQSSSKQSPIAIKEDSPKIIGTVKKITAESFKNGTSLDVIERIQETIESISTIPQETIDSISTIPKGIQETIESISKVPQETIKTIESISKVPQGIQETIESISKKSAITPPEIKSSPVAGGVGLGSRGAEIVKSPIETPEIPEIPKQKEGFLGDKISFEKFVEKVISTKTAKSAITPPEIKSSPVADDSGVAVKKDRYEYYLNELLTQQKVGGNALSKSQIKEGFLKRKDKISFEKFVEKVISTKTVKSAITPPEIKSSPVAGGVGLGSRGGGLVKSPTGALEKYVSGVSKPPGVSKPKKMGGIEDDISKITKSVISIAEILSGQKKLKDSSTSYDRRKAEQEKRSLAESKLEKRFDGLKKAAEKILAPVKSLLDKIINFFVTVFLGRIVYKLLEWFGDPKNADKVKSISRFLKDFGPAILTAFVLFGTSFGRLTLGLTKMIGGFIFKIGKVLIPKLLKLIARNPKVALAAGLFTAGATIPAMFPGTVDEQEKKTKSKPGSTEDKIKALEQQKANLNPLQKMQGVGSEIDEQLSALKTGQTKSYGFSGGGSVKIPAFKGGGLNFKGMFGGALGSSPEKPEEMPNGFVSGEKGVDKVPAMLSDGEFVMSTGAVRKYGVDTLEGMNAAGGGTNKPKMMGGKTYAAGGGRVGYEGEDPIADILAWFKSQGIDPSNPKTWFPPGNSGGGGSSPPPGNSGGGGFKFPEIPGVPGLPGGGGGGFKFPEIPGVPGLPGGGGGGFKFPEIPGVPGLPPGLPGGFNPEKYIPEEYRGDYNRAKKAAGEGIDFVRGKVGQGIDFVRGQVGNARNNAIRDGYLSKRGRYEGAAKAQNNNFLSDMLPNLPGISNLNKVNTEAYLSKIGIGRNTKNITKQGENFTKAFYQGKSGIDRGYNVGQLQVNKMSGESKDYYLKKVKEGLSNGTLKSGDTITPYDLSSKDPRRREEGTLRFYVGPDGSPYLMDTYGFDPGKVNLGSEQKKYDETVAKFRSGKSIMGKIAKSLNLKPLADATEGGEKVQFALALRNKIFGYDPEEEAKSKLGMRFKTKVQVDELRKSMSPEELKQLLQLGKDQLSTNETSLLRNADKKNDAEKLKKEKVEPIDQKNQKQLEKNRPFYDPFGTFGGASRVIKDKEKEFASTGFGGKYASPSTTSLGPAKLYTKPQPNTKQPYKSKFARPKNAGTSPVNPPIRPTRPTTLPTGSGSSSGGSSTSGGKKSSGAGSQTPSFSARNPSGGRTKRETLGLMR